MRMHISWKKVLRAENTVCAKILRRRGKVELQLSSYGRKALALGKRGLIKKVTQG